MKGHFGVHGPDAEMEEEWSEKVRPGVQFAGIGIIVALGCVRAGRRAPEKSDKGRAGLRTASMRPGATGEAHGWNDPAGCRGSKARREVGHGGPMCATAAAAVACEALTLGCRECGSWAL